LKVIAISISDINCKKFAQTFLTLFFIASWIS
jgi:hypothetical protein